MFWIGVAVGSLLVIPALYFRLKNIQTTGRTHNREKIMGKWYYVLDTEVYELKIDWDNHSSYFVKKRR